jgi:hypothetical protein
MNIPFLYPKSEKKNTHMPVHREVEIDNECCEQTIDIDFDTYQSPILRDDRTEEIIIIPYFDEEDWNNTSGFTAVGLAVVLVIIATLIGAFHSGESLANTINCVCKMSPTFDPKDPC